MYVATYVVCATIGLLQQLLQGVTHTALELRLCKKQLFKVAALH